MIWVLQQRFPEIARLEWAAQCCSRLVGALEQHGAKYITLSTQESN